MFVKAAQDIPVLSVSGLVVLHDEHIAAPGHHAGQCDDFFSPVTKFQCRTAREMITLVGWKELIFRPRLKIGLKSVGVHRQSAPLIFCHFNITDMRPLYTKTVVISYDFSWENCGHRKQEIFWKNE